VFLTLPLPPLPFARDSIMNDVILNRRVTILDKEALVDAKRSLTVMLGDFLRQHKVRGGGRSVHLL